MSRSRIRRRTDHIAGVLVLLAAGSCAREQAPPGGPPDLSGPQVVATVPDTFTVIEAFDGPIRINFNERISERGATGTLDQTVQISPESGEIEVRHRKDHLEVRMEGGFLPDLVYRVTVLPSVQDLFRNAMPRPFEFIFSTGAVMLPNALAGTVFDRLTGDPMEGVRVTARAQPLVVGGVGDVRGPTHVAITDSSGVFAFRYLPPVGRYLLTGFEDANRNREPDFFEPIGDAFQVMNGADTVFTDMHLLRPDTTAARVTGANAVDSVTVSIQFDDYLDPDSPLAGVAASLTLDSIPVAFDVREIMHERDYQIRSEAIADSLRVADSLQIIGSLRVADSLRAAGDTAGALEVDEARPAPRPAPTIDQRAEETRDLPKRTIYLLLSDTLVFDETYEVSVSGVQNINGVKGGGGTDELLRAAPPVDSVALADSIAAADSAAARVDSIAPDTIPSDTVSRDTIPTDTIPTDTIPTDTIPTHTIPTHAVRTDPSPREALARVLASGTLGLNGIRTGLTGVIAAVGTPLPARRRRRPRRRVPT